jgi:hypothetical protein
VGSDNDAPEFRSPALGATVGARGSWKISVPVFQPASTSPFNERWWDFRAFAAI